MPHPKADIGTLYVKEKREEGACDKQKRHAKQR